MTRLGPTVTCLSTAFGVQIFFLFLILLFVNFCHNTILVYMPLRLVLSTAAGCSRCHEITQDYIQYNKNQFCEYIS